MNSNRVYHLEPQLAENRRFWAGWSGSDPDADLAIYRAGIPHQIFNGVLRVRQWSLDEAVAETKRQLAGLPWVWWVGEDSDAGVADRLRGMGAEQTSSMPVMAADLAQTAQRTPLPDGLTIVHVSERSTMPDFVSAYATSFALPADSIDMLIEHELKDIAGGRKIVRLAAVLDQRMVGTAMITLGPAVAGLFCVKTDPAHRRRGIGNALTLAALHIAREAGQSIVTLQATPAGKPLYERLGFTTVSHYRLFTFPAG
jgi:ribosomal protein S18 acetylase RimI-like enzyme